MPNPHVSELIARAVRATLQNIINIGSPVSDVGNSQPSDSFVVETSGNYSFSDVYTNYQIRISKAGKSGVAECTITDMTNGDDTVALPVVIISGQDIDLGTRGGKIRFTFDASTSLVLGDEWTVTCSIFNNTVRKVYRAKANGITLNSYPSIVIATGNTEYGSPESNSYSPKLNMYIEMWVEERNEEEIDSVLIKAKQDLETALQVDPSWGGIATDTVLKSNNPGIPLAGTPFGVIAMDVEVSYEQAF